MTADQRHADGVDAGAASVSVQALREVILEADPRIREEVKWNSPSFTIAEHFATMHIRPSRPLLLILHAGAKKSGADLPSEIDDPDGLLEWKSGERAVLAFRDSAEISERRASVQHILRDWIAATQ
ncbi:DUF1801 domain-containing protein [Herbiconiux sp. L3-i23]|uniref:DUF1801 domain-containing protein n=1 Tax=Herbiconiux sp. L3-i23 TaxID=2905871 RepID=UPI002060A57C|nr:DUF1801 domain-containing protein [Herbiconiux sp. L3-i23]BDI22872.1 hypothetical protein L3i23_16480 [Herbiconiux sp. L3-i23]